MMRIPREIFDVMRPMPPFKPELRQANRDGKKSQTRRVVKDTAIQYLAGNTELVIDFKDRCPYGRIGSIVYMREPLVEGKGGYAFYKDDGAPVLHAYTGFHVQWEWKVKTLSQLYMPKFAARSIFYYLGIRVERLNEITEDDAVAEGCKAWLEGNQVSDSAVSDYAHLWNEINLDRGFGWETNPLVWVIGYKPLEVKHG